MIGLKSLNQSNYEAHQNTSTKMGLVAGKKAPNDKGKKIGNIGSVIKGNLNAKIKLSPKIEPKFKSNQMSKGLLKG